MQSGIALWPGQHDARRRADHARDRAVTTIVALGRDVRERLRHRAQVAHAVVDDGDVDRGARHRGLRVGLERALGRRDDAGGARIGLAPPCAARARTP